MNSSEHVRSIRSFNRFYTQILGLLNRRFLGSEQSLTELRVLLEISRTVRCTANMLAGKLEIDRSYMSRIIKQLEKNGLIEKTQALHDQRVHFIALTPNGLEALMAINRQAESEIETLLLSLNEQQIEQVLTAMQTIRTTLSAATYPSSIRPFQPGDLDELLQIQRALYEEEFAVAENGSRAVEQSLFAFAYAIDAQRECLLVAEHNGRPIGCIGVTTDIVAATTAQIRYFFLAPRVRGRGIGHALFRAALAFCRNAGYHYVEVDISRRLPAARLLLQRYQFKPLAVVERLEPSPFPAERWQLKLQYQTDEKGQ